MYLAQFQTIINHITIQIEKVEGNGHAFGDNNKVENNNT
jgi:hypothetical protein